MPELVLTRRELRRLLLRWQGLSGPYRFVGKAGALAYVRQAGCIQFDPIDICGRNAELTLQSRVKGFRREDLGTLLYVDRALFEYPDKELSLIPTEDWPAFGPVRSRAAVHAGRFEGMAAAMDAAMAYITAHGPVSSDTLPLTGSLRWNSAIHWSGNWHGESKAARAALEQLYSEGRLLIHHREGSRKFYDLAQRHLPETLLAAPNPSSEPEDAVCWSVLRRIGAVGALWDKRSDALLGIHGLTTEGRKAAFRRLTEEGRILPVKLRETGGTFYVRAEAMPLLEEGGGSRRCELLAPLDPLLWDRSLVETVFDFRYRWEIYVPKEKRQYGYYVLPLLYGEGFVGRAEAVADRQRGVLSVRGLWLEPGVRKTKALMRAVEAALRRLARFNGCGSVEFGVDFT